MADKLIKSRSIVRTAVTKTTSAAKSEISNDNPDAGNLRRSLANLQGKLENLRIWNKDILEITSMDDIEEEVGTADDYDSRIFEACSDISAKLEEINQTKANNELDTSRTSSVNSENQSSVSIKTSGLVKLPKFEINKFNGKIAEWTSFWTCFEVGIHENTELNAKTKLLYLNGVLEGEAAEIVRGLAINDKNYEFAIEQLKRQYGRPELIRGTHLKALSTFKPILRSTDVAGLRKMYNECKFHVQSLETLGMDSTVYGDVVGPYLISVIPEPLKVEFSRKYKDEWTLRDFLTFFNEEVETRGRVARHKDETNSEQTNRSERQSYLEPRKLTPRLGSAAALTTTFDRCRFCDDTGHQGRYCPLEVEQRRGACMRKGLCFRCLKGKHIARDCPSTSNCRQCNWAHHTWVCNRPPNTEENEEISDIGASVVVRSAHTSIWLQTVYVDVIGPTGKRRVRCFLDGGSEGTFISSKLTSELTHPSTKMGQMKLKTFGNEKPKIHEIKIVKLLLRHPTNDKIQVNIDAIEVPYITKIPHRQPSSILTKLLAEKKIRINKYDDCYYDDEIHLLVGNDYYWQIATGAIESITKEMKAIDTKFGWSLMGRDLHTASEETQIMTVGINHVSIREETNDILRKFWELDAIGILPEIAIDNKEEKQIVKRFKDTTTWNGEYYEVEMPWKRDPTDLDANEAVALRRFWNLARKMKKNEQLYQRYNDVISDQIREEILEEVESNKSPYPTYYIPHRPIIKEERITTKLRIVYDASSHGKGCLSLNECLHKGPNDLPELIDLLNELRKGNVAIIADIKQAFHRVMVRREDRDVMRFFWTQEGWQKHERIIPRILRSTRVMFGTTASPFLLSATIKLHLDKMNHIFPETCAQLRQSMYVDDLVVSVNSQQEASKLYSESKEILRLANMQLVKWRTNAIELKNELKLKENEPDDQTNCVKILGLQWNTEKDELGLDTQEIVLRIQKTNWTKRNLIQTTATLFDPLGFVEPFTIIAKILFQLSWRLKIGWDSELPEEIKTPWQRWCSQINDLKKFSISRQILPNLQKGETTDLHLFCDASLQAYGVVAYLTKGKSSSMCIAKSRVAPIKELTIPRLELMAALLAARLIKTITTQHSIGKITCWTDSQISLCWIRDPSSKIKPFISNRVGEIKQITEISWWRHCPGTENPADLLTRGLESNKLLNAEIWWKGPSWLTEESKWPKEKKENEEFDERLNEKIITSCNLEKTETICNIEKFSDWTRLARVTAYVKRFASNLKDKFKEKNPLSTSEINKAEEYWVKSAQNEVYQDEKRSLESKKPISAKSRLTGIKLIIDYNHILRIENRLKFSNLANETKCPAVVPPNHHLATLLVQYCHQRVFHGGLSETLTELKSKFWIPRARSLIKRQLAKCFLCRRLHQRKLSETVGPLPKDRVRENPPFDVTGVDFAEPLYLKNRSKSYVALFTCAVTRAIHLELVTNQSTDCFIMAFKRFIGRRAIPRIIYSDNAKTFKRTEKEINFLFNYFKEPRIQDFMTTRKITWKYIVETAPWWGGFWERLVRSTKTALKKVLGRNSLEFEELSTTLIEVEAVINSRPLTYVYSEPNEPEALTPGHFLVGQRVASLPDTRLGPNLSAPSTAVNLFKKWRYRQRLLDGFWKRWSHEYLTELGTFTTKPSSEKIAENSIVLIEDINRARWQWKIGRVSKLHIGRDQRVRSCEIQLPDHSSLRRPIQRLCLLEVPFEKSSDGGRGECKN